MTGSARQVLDAVLDAGSFSAWDLSTTTPAGPARYLAELAVAVESTGHDEAVLVGEGRLEGRRVAVLVGEFGFLAGSVGIATAQRITAAIDRATQHRLPLLAAPVSGGTRMQEGTAAFVQMTTVAAALATHRRAGLPYLVWLRNPTFGGVFASWGSLGQVTAAEPGAAVGFLGPRVYHSLYGQPFPSGVQTAENLQARGVIDAVVSLDRLRSCASSVLAVMCAPRTGFTSSADDEGAPDPAPATTWDSVLRTRAPGRPGVREVLRHAGVDVVELHGTGRGETGPALLLGLARLREVPCVVVGQDRVAQRDGPPLGPADLRVARRGMALAQELGLPLVTVVDTSGADLSQQAEEGALAAEIAACLFDLANMSVPTLAVLLGEGAGGGALALAGADRVVAARHAWLAPLPPEGASAIVHRDTHHAAELATAQGIGAADLLLAGVVDRVVDERPDAANEPASFSRRLISVVRDELVRLTDQPDERLRLRRLPRGTGRRRSLV